MRAAEVGSGLGGWGVKVEVLLPRAPFWSLIGSSVAGSSTEEGCQGGMLRSAGCQRGSEAQCVTGL